MRRPGLFTIATTAPLPLTAPTALIAATLDRPALALIAATLTGAALAALITGHTVRHTIHAHLGRYLVCPDQTNAGPALVCTHCRHEIPVQVNKTLHRIVGYARQHEPICPGPPR